TSSAGTARYHELGPRKMEAIACDWSLRSLPSRQLALSGNSGLLTQLPGSWPMLAKIFWPNLNPPNDAPYKVVDEFMLNTLELVTGVCSRVDEGLDQLATAGTQLLDVLTDERLGLY